MKRYYSIFLILTVFHCGVLWGQQKVNVITKTIERSIEVSPSDSLLILAEKAVVRVRTWDQNEVQVVLKLKSSHKEKAIAEKEMEYLGFEISKTDGLILLKNFFQAYENFASVKGLLSATYDIQIPKNLHMRLFNQYGEVVLTSLENPTSIDLQFVELEATKCTNLKSIRAFFGSSYIDGCSGILDMNLQKSESTIIDFEGPVEIRADFSRVNVEGTVNEDLIIEGNRTAVNFLLGSLTKYNYHLETSFSRVTVPAEFEKDSKNIFKYRSDANNPTISVKTSYQPINLKLYYNASKN